MGVANGRAHGFIGRPVPTLRMMTANEKGTGPVPLHQYTSGFGSVRSISKEAANKPSRATTPYT